MEKITKDNILNNLKYLGLGEDGVFPEFLHSFEPISFPTTRLNNDRDHKVYKFIPIDKIQILLTPCLRGDDIKDKFDKAIPLVRFINPTGNEDDVEKYAILLSLINKLQISEVENIKSMQKEIKHKEPFRVRYNHDSLWQIYYSEPEDSYFMLVCTREQTFSEFLYLLKTKIEYNKNDKPAPKIFVPINYMNYSGQILDRDEIADVENYLWVFTKNWPLVFEVYDKNNKISLQVVGDTYVYQDIKSTYKMTFTNQEEAINFFKLLKALFIMNSEIKNEFKFTTEINSKSELCFYRGKTKIDYSGLEEFIRDEYLSAVNEIKMQLDTATTLENKLNKLKKDVYKKEQEYLDTQRQISTFLEYKKSFFGKVKFFIKGTKSLKVKKSIEDKIRTDIDLKQDTKSEIVTENIFQEKNFYTIDDLVTVYSVKEKNNKIIKNIKNDTKAQKLKYTNLNSKVKNAKQYIAEIDKHRKSIFEFWKFANKDEILALEEGSLQNKGESTSTVKKLFNLETDMEKLGQEVDIKQRKLLTQAETDAVFIAKSNLLNELNLLKNRGMDEGAFDIALMALKEEFNQNKKYNKTETFDIFGNVDEDNTKLRYIGASSHRESDKSKFKILGINKKLDVFDFIEKLSSTVDSIKSACSKIESKYDMPLYKVVSISNNIKKDCFDIYNMDVEDELTSYEDDGDEGAINLIKINFKEGMPLVYYSNITLLDNNNQTLPEGMNLSTNVLLDCSKFKFKQVNKVKFRTNNYFTDDKSLYLKAKDIILFEYDVVLKGKNKK